VAAAQVSSSHRFGGCASITLVQREINMSLCRAASFTPLKPIRHATITALAIWASTSCHLVFAQTAPPPDSTDLDRVEVTGSLIKRIDGETALPVQVITRSDIEKTGATTAGELLSTVSANTAALTDGASFSDIPGQRGFNGANLRGIGVSSTLVLLNGRRLANFASPGDESGVDLNTIPVAAIERVEILKDGASAIYGSDAIGGVINFITRNNYDGGEITAYRFQTQHGGADKSEVTLSAGFGSLVNDRYNIFAVLDAQDNTSLRSGQRSWIGSAYQPGIGLDVGSSNTFPANVRVTDPSGNPTGNRYNPSAPQCNPPATVYEPNSFIGPNACYYNYMQDTEIFPESKRLSLLSRAQYALSNDTTLFAETLYSDTKTQYRISPLTINDLNYPANGIYYPTSLGLTGPLAVNLRLNPAGGRTNDVDSTAQRYLIGVDGVIWGWDYNGALNHSEDRVTDDYASGYVATTAFDNAFATGLINPFGASGAAGNALLHGAEISDPARNSVGVTDSLDAHASRPIYQLPGGDAAISVGFEVRHESLTFTPSTLLEEGEIRGDGPSSAFSGGRTVEALYSELELPLTKQLDAQIAARADHYSDVGTTVNPKIGLRYAPVHELVFRASAGTGFRAPSLADLYSPSIVGETNGVYNDPLGCIKTATIDNTNNPDYCGIQPNKLTGGNANLKPEKSTQFSTGVVFEPSKSFTATIDYWRIDKTNDIISPEGAFFADPSLYSQYIIRGPADPALPGIPGPIITIDSRLRNFAALKTSGIDVSLDHKYQLSNGDTLEASLNGTYVIDYKTQEAAGSPYVSGLGLFLDDQAIQRWRHYLSLSYGRGPLSVSLSQTFYLGYRDQQQLDDGSYRRVGSYSLWDLTGNYKLAKDWTLRAGLKNLFDTNPPASNQEYYFLAGYDPTYTDPRGRSIYASLTYKFK
jgi:iron complex outermembrane receptor protein